ncbi:hypothetical protein K4F52_002898 [Lecanicillium sp. MT-2017a]|nr:hypothetical protein K4F52_002898 [Lecanicillium sp. MT-2017a]
MIVVEDYNKNWPETFRNIRDTVSEVLGNLAERVEHVGSTSVPGLAAKPIIDIDVVISSRQKLSEVIPALATLGYHHQGDLGISGREAFTTPKNVPRHNLYVCDRNSRELRRHVAFRDYLRQNEETVRKYGELKKTLAVQFSNDIKKSE